MNLFEREEIWKSLQKWKLDCYDCNAIWLYFQRLGKINEWEYLYDNYIKEPENSYIEYSLIEKRTLLEMAKTLNDIQMIQFIHDEISIFPNKFVVIF